jgi:lycopene cyclase domain-containing protein
MSLGKSETLMTYFGFLLRFLVLPILFLAALTWWDARRNRRLAPALATLHPAYPLALLVLIALLYTTPWDNYLVATRVWWYDPNLVTGVTVGYVPIEEYSFFVLQTVLTGLWVLWLARRLPRKQAWWPSYAWRVAPLILLGALWLLNVGWLALGLRQATYLALILVWALPPIMLQVGFGGDILRRHAWLVTLGILTPTLFLSAVDILAIRAGTWSISPEQTLGLHLPGGLPLEEAAFFLVTNVLVAFGLTLALAEESRSRLRRWLLAARSGRHRAADG